MNSLFEGIEDKASVHGSADAPTDNIAGKNVDYESDIDKARPRRNIGEISNPQLVGPIGFEVPIDFIEGTLGRLIANRCFYWLTTDSTFQAHAF